MPSVKVVGAMSKVMWKGEIAGVIDLDTIQNRNGLFGLGPEEYLTGEILIIDGKSYVSKVLSDFTMTVEETFKTKAPFFVYANQKEWNLLKLPGTITTISDLEAFIDRETTNLKRPFVFKLKGRVKNANIHIQNLPKGTKVGSPDEAHLGQKSYSLKDKEVEIVGFFSTEHKGIFTHHDSNVHMHLITTDKKQMGHLDKIEVEPEKTILYVPKK